MNPFSYKTGVFPDLPYNIKVRQIKGLHTDCVRRFQPALSGLHFQIFSFEALKNFMYCGSRVAVMTDPAITVNAGTAENSVHTAACL